MAAEVAQVLGRRESLDGRPPTVRKARRGADVLDARHPGVAVGVVVPGPERLQTEAPTGEAQRHDEVIRDEGVGHDASLLWVRVAAPTMRLMSADSAAVACRPVPGRAVSVDGLVNVRDLGGLRLSGGGLTPTGVFFRSESIDAVTAGGWEDLWGLGVRTIVDLRQPRERVQDRNARPGWVTTTEVDLDGLEHESFWKDYWDNGLVATALYYTPHLRALPERAGAALAAIVDAPGGGVLFHCVGGRDRTGMIAMLLLAAVGADPEEIVDDYLATVRLGAVRARRSGGVDPEPEIEALCRSHGTTTEAAFRDALNALDLTTFLDGCGLSAEQRLALTTWRGALPGDQS